MGGLLTGEMLRKSQDSLTGILGPVITLGTPFGGSLDTYLKTQGWDDLMPPVTNSATRETGKNWPAGYQLLPQWDFVNDESFLSGRNVPKEAVYRGDYRIEKVWNQTLLERAFDFWLEAGDNQITPRHTQSSGADIGPLWKCPR